MAGRAPEDEEPLVEEEAAEDEVDGEEAESADGLGDADVADAPLGDGVDGGVDAPMGVGGGVWAAAAAVGDMGAGNISALMERRKALQRERDMLSRSLRAEEKRRARRMERARGLSDQDLLDIITSRAAAKARGVGGWVVVCERRMLTRAVRARRRAPRIHRAILHRRGVGFVCGLEWGKESGISGSIVVVLIRMRNIRRRRRRRSPSPSRRPRRRPKGRPRPEVA